MSEKQDPREVLRGLREEGQRRSAENARRKEYVKEEKEHEGMIIPFNAPTALLPGSPINKNNYLIEKFEFGFGVRRTHAPEDVPGKLLQTSNSHLIDPKSGMPASFDTKEEAVKACHKDRLDRQEYSGGIYFRRGELSGWEVIVPRHEELNIPKDLNMSPEEENWYLDM